MLGKSNVAATHLAFIGAFVKSSVNDSIVRRCDGIVQSAGNLASVPRTRFIYNTNYFSFWVLMGDPRSILTVVTAAATVEAKAKQQSRPLRRRRCNKEERAPK